MIPILQLRLILDMNYYIGYNVKDETLKWTQKMIYGYENDDDEDAADDLYGYDDNMDDEDEDEVNYDHEFSDSDNHQVEFTSFGVHYRHLHRSTLLGQQKTRHPLYSSNQTRNHGGQLLQWYDWDEEYQKATFYFYAKMVNISLPAKVY